ncbi:hypothetical protein [Absidia glauca]|uniref:ACB domain-containing protein n=1 Tax=Absidia glauca TaxID=4829 RepID=A0A168RTG1_ABSGL|nr:hypothetical protein [Absidia glauca]
MTSTIPSHYSNRHVQQRYNKALQIVQHLSVSSFQPTKDQKLQLYAFYKQVSIGNVNTSRPGLFDMVGRAKWDAWKKLEGISKLEAQHQYVETLLLAASEAYQKPATKAQAQQIIQAFATMRPVGGDDDTSDDEMTTTTATTTEDDNEESSQGSVDEEEKAYLIAIEQTSGRRTTNEGRPPRRTPTQRLPFLRPKSAASSSRLSPSPHFDPWARTDSRSTTHTATSSQRHTFASPFHSSAASSVTATLSNVQQHQQLLQRRPVSLGPATQRALESLQAEVIALNDRIDDLRNELVRRDRAAQKPVTKDDDDDEDEWEGWRWVIKIKPPRQAQEWSYFSHRESIGKALSSPGIRPNKKTHIMYSSSACMAVNVCANVDQIRRHGRWNNTTIYGAYSHQSSKRISATNELSPGDPIRPTVAENAFVQVIMMFRKTFIQDSVLMMELHPCYSIGNIQIPLIQPICHSKDKSTS